MIQFKQFITESDNEEWYSAVGHKKNAWLWWWDDEQEKLQIKKSTKSVYGGWKTHSEEMQTTHNGWKGRYDKNTDEVSVIFFGPGRGRLPKVIQKALRKKFGSTFKWRLDWKNFDKIKLEHLTENAFDRHQSFLHHSEMMFPGMEIIELGRSEISFHIRKGNLREVEKVVDWLERNDWKHHEVKGISRARYKRVRYAKGLDILYLDWT